MIGVDRSLKKTVRSSDFPPLRVRLEPEDLQALIGQIQASENANQVSGASISGALFGSLQNGVSHVRYLQPFSSMLGEPTSNTLSEPALKGLELIGWYCVRQTGQMGLSRDDVDFHRAYFPRRTDIALILRRAETDGYRAEIYSRSATGEFSREDHRCSSFSLSSDPPLTNESFHVAVQRAIGDNSYLRSYEVTSTLERQAHWQEWKSRLLAFCNPNWLRVLPRRSRIKEPYSTLDVAGLVIEATPIASPANTSIKTTESSTGAAVVASDANPTETRDVSPNQRFEDIAASKLDDATPLPNDVGLDRVQAENCERQPSTPPLFDEYENGRKPASEENPIAAAESWVSDRSLPSNPKAKFIPWGRFGLLRIIALVVVVVTLAGMLAIILLRHGPQNFRAKGEASQATALGFEPVRSDPGWELHWDAGSPSFRTAKAGVLTITDGAQVRKLELDRSQLQTGRVRYVPETQDVNFRLQIYTQNNRSLSESVRILGGTISGPSTSNIAHEVRVSDTRTSPNQSTLPGDAAFSRGTSKVRLLPSKPMAPLFVGSAQRRPKQAFLAAEATTASKPIAPSAAPALADQSGMSSSSYIGPQPLQKPTTNVTSLSGRTDSVREVGVEVYIDDSGRVMNARIVNANSNVSPTLQKAAISDALQWTFEPARLHGNAVSSIHKILFRFNRLHESARKSTVQRQ